MSTKTTSVSTAKAALRPPIDLARPLTTAKAILLHPGYRTLMQYALIAGEVLLCSAIVAKVPFTNIDWKAYMEQVELFIGGERNYRKIRGDTGPLVYPGGFLWIFSVFYYICDYGKNIRRAQVVFAAIYVVTLAIVCRLYKYSAKIPPYAYVLLTLSKRLHSLYVLRCFNDCVVSLFLHASILALCQRRWTLSSVLFSLSLSVKMSVLLIAPAYGLLLLACTGLVETFKLGLVMLGVQMLAGLPFLLEDWHAYLSRAFEFTRVFIPFWSVNWRFLPDSIFLSGRFAVVLLLCHGFTLCFAAVQWSRPLGGLHSVVMRCVRHPQQPASLGKTPSAQYMITVLFSCNIIGMLFARSLHYQFYAWEAHQIVFLLWQTSLPVPAKLALLAGVEVGYEIFPSNSFSSASLVVSHACIVAAVLFQVDWATL